MPLGLSLIYRMLLFHEDVVLCVFLTGSGAIAFVATSARYLTSGLVMARPVAMFAAMICALFAY